MNSFENIWFEKRKKIPLGIFSNYGKHLLQEKFLAKRILWRRGAGILWGIFSSTTVFYLLDLILLKYLNEKLFFSAFKSIYLFFKCEEITRKNIIEKWKLLFFKKISVKSILFLIYETEFFHFRIKY